ncbi:hypothetical protein DE146DRAFT_657596 [Phaeosphaeria sp. MPI-PUGE-AT-0046c]|nr:hypothetical protein DE146DRAFT_657596 [Phaeosphaeria sp. MPI-PUGE-AT-0046c]
MDTAAEWLRELHYPSDIDGQADLIRSWGFTIYRTAYGPSSEQQWQQLLQTMQKQAEEKILSSTDATEDDPTFQHLWSLFRLDARSDPALANLPFEQLRQLYIAGEGVAPMNTNLRSHRVFLAVDEEVLSGVEGCIVKCVEADYLAEEHVPRCPRRYPQRYFGWFKMTVKSVVGLWKELETFPVETVAPQTIGGSHLVVWEDEL